MDTLPDVCVKGVIEAMLFISEKPVMIEQMKEVLKSGTTAEIRHCIHQLKAEYEQQKRGMGIVEIAGGYQMLSNPRYVSYVRSFLKTRVKEKLTNPSLETLAVVAYKQPVSRADVELIRGVNSDGIVGNLSDKGLIKVVGRRDVPGRPYLYGTTKLFLEYFGLKSLDDLPKFEKFSDILPVLPDAPIVDCAQDAEVKAGAEEEEVIKK